MRTVVNRLRRVDILLAVLPVLLALAVGCTRPPEAAAPPKAPDQAAESAESRVVKPERGPVHLTIAEPGYVQAYEETPMYAKVPGYVNEWKADIGDRVTEGQTLAVLSVPELDVDLARKNALIQQADEEVKLARAAVDVAKAEYDLLQGQSGRLAKGGESGLLAKEGVMEAQFQAQSARAKMEQANVDVGVQEAKKKVAIQERDYVQAMLGYTTLKAPYNGIVTRRNINRGDFVQPATGGKGDPLFVVRMTDLMRVFVAAPEEDADWIRVGNKAPPATEAHIRVEALKGKEFTGPVVRTSWSLDPKERTLLAEIDLPNPHGADSYGELRPGMYVYATLKSVRADAWTLPASAVVTRSDQTQGDQTFCYLVEGDKPVKTPLKIGVHDGPRVEVLGKQTGKDGGWEPLTGEEKIVEDSSKLTPEQAAPPAAK